MTLLTEPAVGHHADEVLRRQRLEHGDEEGHEVFVLGILGFEQEVLVVEDHLAVHVLNQDPERLGRPVNLRAENLKCQEAERQTVHVWSIVGLSTDLVIPLEVRRDGELHFQSRAGDGLQMDGQVQFGELVDVFVDRLPHFRHSDQLA